jgi:hypothetical protein
MRYLLTLILAVSCLLISCTNSTTNPDSSHSSNPSAAKAEKQSEARRISHQVKADLDTTTLEQMMGQMPNTPSNTERRGQNRIFTWTFSDGSKIIATFRPKGAEGSGQGLVLYMVELRD